LLSTAGIEVTDEKLLKTAVVLGCFHSFSNIIDHKDVPGFDIWLITQFRIDVPPEWAGYSIPEQFCAVLKRPSLLSMRLYCEKLISLNITALAARPILQLRADEQSPIMIEDVVVVHV
jgi:hypothetical protein